MSHSTLTSVKNEVTRLINLLDVGTPSTFGAACSTLRAAAAKLSKIGETECNGVLDRATGFMRWNEADQARADEMREVEEKRAEMAVYSLFDAATCARLDLEFQGDPRGCSITIGIKNGPSRVVALY